MNAFEIKGGLYDMIARVNDKELLVQIHELISRLISQNLDKTDFWDELGPEGQAALDKAIEESNSENLLIDHATAEAQILRWIRNGQ